MEYSDTASKNFSSILSNYHTPFYLALVVYGLLRFTKRLVCYFSHKWI